MRNSLSATAAKRREIPRLVDRHRDGDQPAVPREPHARLAAAAGDNSPGLGDRVARNRTPRPTHGWRARNGSSWSRKCRRARGIGEQCSERRPRSTCPLAKFCTTGRMSGRCCAELITARPLAVGKDGELVVGAGHRHPHRGEPVEVADVPLQRSGRALVPRRVKADVERLAHRGCDGGRFPRADLARARRLGPEQRADGQRSTWLLVRASRVDGRRALRIAMFERDRQRRLRRERRGWSRTGPRR